MYIHRSFCFLMLSALGIWNIQFIAIPSLFVCCSLQDICFCGNFQVTSRLSRIRRTPSPEHSRCFVQHVCVEFSKIAAQKIYDTMSFSPRTKQKISIVLETTKVVFHWGFIPAVLYLGWSSLEILHIHHGTNLY